MEGFLQIFPRKAYSFFPRKASRQFKRQWMQALYIPKARSSPKGYSTSCCPLARKANSFFAK